MAWLPDQPNWGQDEIYGSPLADASGWVPPFAPDIDPTQVLGYEAYLSHSTNDTRHLGHDNQYHTMPASPRQWASIAGPSIPNPTTGLMINPHPTVNQPTIMQASSRPDPRPRTRKKDTKVITDTYTQPRSAPTFECKWEGCNYSGSFKRDHELIRHLRKIHITPLAHFCPVEGCDKVCNREDNLLQHMKNRHGFR